MATQVEPAHIFELVARFFLAHSSDTAAVTPC
jgi:hypothetical protein